MSYGGDPAANTRDRVRFLLFDTSNDSNKEFLTNTEIDFLLTEYGAPLLAAAAGAETISTKFAQNVDRSVGGISSSGGQRAAFYLELADRLRRRAMLEAEVFIGGRKKSDKQSLAEDDDAVQPSFSIGMDDQPIDQHGLNEKSWTK